jgi:very-short-patch-repair endonuclease
VRIGGRLVDFFWRSNRLVVETDGYQYHRGRVAFKDDHSRNLELLAHGYEVVRLSYEQVFHEPATVAAGLRDRLGV